MSAEPVVYVIDDDPSVLKSMERLLRSAGLEVQTFQSALDFLSCSVADQPACLVCDVRMPGISGLELQEKLVLQHRRLPVIFITGFGNVPASVKAMKAGAVDFLEKPFDDQTLLDAVHLAIHSDMLHRQESSYLDSLKRLSDQLTKREREVFNLVVTGMLNKQIACQLGITEKTVKVHRARIMQKMKVQSLADLVRLSEKLK